MLTLTRPAPRALAIALLTLACVRTNPWPVETVNVGHPVGNSSREYQMYGGAPYYHGGMDVREPPAPNGPWLVSVDGGSVAISYSGNPIYHGVIIGTTDTVSFGYWHVDSASITADVLDAWTDGTAIAGNIRMGQIVNWPACGFHHVHFYRRRPAGETDPMVYVRPNDEQADPAVTEVTFAQNTTDTYFGGSPPSVSGDVDIVARISDQILTTGHITGAYNVRYSIQRRIFKVWFLEIWWTVLKSPDLFPGVWRPADATAATVFQTAAPRSSNSNYCGAEEYFYVLTNGNAAGYDDATGFWDTDGGGFANGRYRVRVTARDASGNEGTRTQEVDVAN